MLRLAIALCLTGVCLGQVAAGVDDPFIIEEKNVLSPPYFNIAAGKRIATTATCGTEGPELFCKLTGGTNFEFSNSLHQGQVCDVCDANNPEKSHAVKNAIDGTEKWWQSPPLSRGNEYNKVNLTIHLGQVFHVAYVLIKFANSPRAGTWVLERSSDNGRTFQPWQYFANTDSDCYNLFGMGSLEEITRDDSVVCTSDYSGVVPLEDGEVIVSMIKGRPGANNFSYSTVLQEWSKATDVRLRFIRTKTLLGHLMAVSEQDPTVTRRYYYSIKDISIGGRCVCNGHADRCIPDPYDEYKLKCQCQHNTCGDSCEFCCPGFVQKAWRVAVPESTNECEECNCHGHSSECVYDEEVAIRRLSLDRYGSYEGGGVCQNCSHNTAGINCEQCASGFWRPTSVDPRDPNGCRAYTKEFGLTLIPTIVGDKEAGSGEDFEPARRDGEKWRTFPPPSVDGTAGPARQVDAPCDCDSDYTVGSCEPSTGRCYCKVQYAGDRCDRCAPGYYDFPECKPCDCNYNGTLNDVCLPEDDAGCPCKYNFAGKYCSECAAGFYKYPECLACECNGEGVASDVCDPYSGACPCADGFAGVQCTECAPGYFKYPLCQRCPCSDVGATGEVCDPVTGLCLCEDKFSGPSCDDCAPGFYGFPQCQECRCTAPGSVKDECDSRSGRCVCHPNYSGDRCDQCAPEYYGYPNCVACACNVRGSLRTTCDQTSGQCLCRENIGGRGCDQCYPDYFNFPRCEECSCDPRGITSVVPGVCLAFTAGQCECKDNVVGRNCDMCAPLHYDLDNGCVSCNCFVQGTLDGVGECDDGDGSCWCKPYTCSQRCSQCEDGFFALEELNYLGCTSCQCDVGGSMTSQCDKNTGQCACKGGVGGRRCDRALDGFFFPTLYQNQFEAEDGRTPQNTIVRAGFDPAAFPDFSMKGYAQFSHVQRTVLIPVIVHNSGLYRIMLRYVNNGSSLIRANVTVSPSRAPDGAEQSQTVVFEPTAKPSMITISTPFVLNKGTWTVQLQAAPGLLVDYVVLLPSQYYEPSLLELSVTVPCEPSLQSSDEECVMFTHPSLEDFTTMDLVRDAPASRVAAPSTAHPEMRRLNGASGMNDEGEFTTSIGLPAAGRYTLVLEYASDQAKLQMAKVSVTDGAGNTYNDGKFNIYSCLYSFTCRQVAIGPLDQVMVFDMSLPTMKVNVQAEAGGSFHVKSVSAIPYDQWTMELVEPKPLCITTRGPAFEECVVSSYKTPFGSVQFGIPAPEDRGEPTSTSRPDNINDADTPLVHLDNTRPDGKTTLQIPMTLNPGRYVFLVHYYNPDHTSFRPDVVVNGGVDHTGTANITYCPNADGCRAVVVTEAGKTVLDITVPTSTFTLVVPEGKAFWVEYVLAVPESEYDPSLLDTEPIDKSSDFIVECSTDGQQSYYSTIGDPTDYCRENVFSLTVDYNEGGVSCDCAGAGTVGGGDAVCDHYGGQCPCKPNVIGRQCDRCMTGFYGYPDCLPCACDGRLCDEESGACVCPPNTVRPSCDSCAPFTHSFHPLLGCVDCDCHVDGVVNATDRGCDSANGQCKCKDLISGQRCDQCQPGYFGFPNCRECTCDGRGSVSDRCDPTTGQCLCKDNVEGLQCDRCKMGSFHLDESNPQGCTECFCFGASDPAECHSSQYPATEIYDMEGWRMLNLVEPKPEVLSVNNGRAVRVLVGENGGQQFPTQPNLYWAAPKSYLGDSVGSYGGQLRYTASWSFSGRGDAGGDPVFASPAPLLGAIPDVLLKGSQMTVGWMKPSPSEAVALELSERNFRHESSGNAVTRPEMMMILADLQALHIRASPEVGVASLMLADVVMTTTDYSRPVGSAAGIETVEECTCPPGYEGHSCQECTPGFYRVDQGPYLGYCRQCECFPFCLTCDENGQQINNDDCLYNTGGPNCGVCEDGYIGNTTTGDIAACKPCPCPFPTPDGNFADTCEEEDGELICHCQSGYTGDTCELCASGYFGNPAVLGGSCQACNCHGNLDPNLVMPTCDPLTGECSDCGFNTGGRYCERCADGFYGDAHVAKNCTACDCNSCGTEACDDKLGFCSCRPHVIGGLCDACEPGYFGFQSCTGCRACNCDVGALGSVCDIETGQCTCAPNVEGLRCDKCAPGHWNFSPSGCRPCNCRNDGRCNPLNGLCECPPGVTGPQCDQCELSRHVLLPGDDQCTRCSSCTDDLLDDVELMTDDVGRSLADLDDVSVGVIAQKRLQELVDRANGLMESVDDEDQLLTSTTTTLEGLLGTGFDEPAFDVSGSGAVDEIDSNPFSKLDQRITDTDSDVTEMCNRTKTLLARVQMTENATGSAVVDSRALQAVTMDFQEEARDLLDDLNDESSGDTEEYFQKLRQAEMFLERMKQRDFAPMTTIADEELAMAEELLRRVEEGFTDPAMNASSRVDALADQLTMTHDKLRDLRSKLNDATQKANDATTMNAVNRKDLAASDAVVESINADSSAANQDITDAEQLLATAKREVDETIPSAIAELTGLDDALDRAYGDLKPEYDALRDGLEQHGPYADVALERARELEADAQALANITGADLENRISAVNAYGRMYNTIEEAETAAEAAVMESRKAQMDIEDRNLEEEAQGTAERSSDMLSATQDLRSNNISDLNGSMDESVSALDELEERKRELTNQLNALNDALDNLDQIALNSDDVDYTVATAEEASRMATEAAARAKDLQDQADRAPDANNDLGRELAEVTDILQDLPDAVSRMSREADNAETKMEELSSLHEELSMSSQIIDIKKEIELARHDASVIKDSIQFSRAVDSEYVQMRPPVTVQDADKYIEVKFAANINQDSPDNHLMYIGDDTAEGDFLSVETVGGRVVYNFKVGDGIGRLQSQAPINNGRWSTITVVRWGNLGKLIVEYEAPDTSRGDESSGIQVLQDLQQVSTNGTDVVANMNGPESYFYMGGNPSSQPPPSLVNLDVGNVCMTGAKVNNETVGTWNLKSYRGRQPAKSCSAGSGQSGGNKVWRFRGQGSYVRIRREDTPFLNGPSSNHFVGFMLDTLQDNSLVFLIGQSIDQFIALEIVDGRLEYSYNFGFDEPVRSVITEAGDVTASSGPLLIKAGLVPAAHLVLVSVDLKILFKKRHDNAAEDNVLGDIWLGGIWPYDINKEIRDYLKNEDVSFRGCIQDLNFNRRSFNIQNAVENIGVTRGCEKEGAQSLTVQGNEYMKLASNLENIDNVEGGLTMNTNTPTGTMMSAAETQDDGGTATVSLRDGRVVFTDGYSELESRDTYADGRDHTISFKKRSDGLMILQVDSGDVQTIAPRASEVARRRRQNAPPSIRTVKVYAYLGGAENSAMFDGCIKFPYLTDGSLPDESILLGARCGVGETVCVGRPVFNACPEKMRALSQREKQRKRKRKNRAHRRNQARQGNRANNLVLSIDAIREGYDVGCSLTYRPQATGYQYTGDGYSKYYVKRFNPSNWRFSLSIRTAQRSGLVFFMSDTRCNEHIAVYLVKGKVVFSVMFGDERSRLKSTSRLNDGAWHQITFERKANVTQLMSDGAIEGQGRLTGESMTFPTNMPFYVGGLHVVPKKFAADPINMKNLADFQGCIKDVAVNNRPADELGNPLRINTSPCFEGGSEPGMFFPHQDSGQSAAYMIALNPYNVAVNLEVSLEMKPRSQTGVIFAVAGTTGNFFNLALVDGRVVARLRQGGETLFSRYEPSDFGGSLCDGRWHSVTVIKARNVLALTVDDNVVTPVEEGSLRNVSCVTNSPLFVGGVPDGAYMEGLLTNNQFAGCIRRMKVDLFPVNPNTVISTHGDITENACPVF